MFSEKNSDKTLSVVLFLSAGVWGLYWFPLRAIEDIGISGSWSVVFFNACPLLVLLPVFCFTCKTLAGVLKPTVFAGLMIGLAFTCYSNGLVETTVVRATLLYYLAPIWLTLIGVIWLSEPLTGARIAAIVIGLIGVVLLLSGASGISNPLNIGDFYSVLSGVFWAFGVAALNRWPNIPILPVTTLIFFFTTVFSALLALISDFDALPEITMFSAVLPVAVFWSIFIFLPCFCIIFRVSQLLFPGRVGILTMSEVLVAIVSAAVFLPGESMATMQWVGATAILLAGLIEVLLGYKRSGEVLTD